MKQLMLTPEERDLLEVALRVYSSVALCDEQKYISALLIKLIDCE